VRGQLQQQPEQQQLGWHAPKWDPAVLCSPAHGNREGGMWKLDRGVGGRVRGQPQQHPGQQQQQGLSDQTWGPSRALLACTWEQGG
jgi:hypothetical protein